MKKWDEWSKLEDIVRSGNVAPADIVPIMQMLLRRVQNSEADVASLESRVWED